MENQFRVSSNSRDLTMAHKLFNQNIKPKGLSMRPASKFNLTDRGSPYKKMTPKSPYKNALTPGRRLLLKKQAIRFEKKMEMSPQKIKEAQKLTVDDNFFKPKPIIYPEPEVLAYELDDSVYDNMYLDSPFRNLTVQDEDEGFISDPEPLPLGPDDFQCLYRHHPLEDEMFLDDLKLMDIQPLELSDLDDDF